MAKYCAKRINTRGKVSIHLGSNESNPALALAVEALCHANKKSMNSILIKCIEEYMEDQKLVCKGKLMPGFKAIEELSHQHTTEAVKKKLKIQSLTKMYGGLKIEINLNSMQLYYDGFAPSKVWLEPWHSGYVVKAIYNRRPKGVNPNDWSNGTLELVVNSMTSTQCTVHWTDK